MEFEDHFFSKADKITTSETKNPFNQHENLAKKFIGVEEAESSELFGHIGRYSEVPRKISDPSMSSIGLSAI